MKETTKNQISRNLAANAALVLLYHSDGDERGLELAYTLESEAHALWRAEGLPDIPTWKLIAATAES